MRRLFEGAEPGAEVGRLDVCDRTHDAQCGVFHQFLAHTAAPAGWICTCIATVLAFIQIFLHLKYYSAPTLQRYIIRLLLMVPIYSTMSACALTSTKADAVYFELARDCYESWIIYNFLTLCYAYVGGPGQVVTAQDGKSVHPSCIHGTCCLPSLTIDGFFLRGCKQGALQFVILKPIMAFLTLILDSIPMSDGTSAYAGGAGFRADRGYAYLAFLYNLCYTGALYALLLFYVAASDLLAPHKPILKFVVVKSVVFFTFWQSLACSFMVNVGILDDARGEAGKLQNFLICCEMVVASIGLIFAFPYTTYYSAAPDSFWDALYHAASLHDVYADIVHQFAGRYNSYILYSDDTEMAPKRHYIRARMDAAMLAAALAVRQGAVVMKEGRLVEVVRDNVLDLGERLTMEAKKVGKNVVGGVQAVQGGVIQMVKVTKEGRLGEVVRDGVLDVGVKAAALGATVGEGLAGAAARVDALARRATGERHLSHQASSFSSASARGGGVGVYDSPAGSGAKRTGPRRSMDAGGGPSSTGSVRSSGGDVETGQPQPPPPLDAASAIEAAWRAALESSSPAAVPPPVQTLQPAISSSRLARSSSSQSHLSRSGSGMEVMGVAQEGVRKGRPPRSRPDSTASLNALGGGSEGDAAAASLLPIAPPPPPPPPPPRALAAQLPPSSIVEADFCGGLWTVAPAVAVTPSKPLGLLPKVRKTPRKTPGGGGRSVPRTSPGAHSDPFASIPLPPPLPPTPASSRGVEEEDALPYSPVPGLSFDAAFDSVESELAPPEGEAEEGEEDAFDFERSPGGGTGGVPPPPAREEDDNPFA